MAAGFAAAFLDFAVSQGANRQNLLAASGLSGQALTDQDNRIPVAAYYTLIKAAIDATQDSAILLRHLFETRIETMSIIGQIMYSSRCFPHSIEQLNRYERLLADVVVPGGQETLELSEEKGAVWLVDNSALNEGWIDTELTFGRFVSEFRRSAPEYPFELELELTHAPPPHADAYSEFFRVPITFNATRNALRIDPMWLHVEYEKGKEYVFGVFTKYADELLSKLTIDTTTRASVETHMLPELHEGTLSMNGIASNLGMSRQTLYRRLRDEGVTFAEVHDDLRRRMAMDYLSARKVSVGETAYLLGFSEASAFVRAFKRWFGMSPTAWLAQK